MKPSESYLEMINIKSIQLKEPLIKKQLLILDLNGTLVSRVKGNKSMYVRPYSKRFFDYVFDNFAVMVWSSAQPHNVKYMESMFLKNHTLIESWDRTSFNLTRSDYNKKTLTIKDLNKIWSHFDQYNETNTILLDDSPKKCQLQPYNCLHPIEFDHNSSDFLAHGDAELLNIMSYLKLLQFQSNVANYIRQNPYRSKGTHTPSFEVEFYQFNTPNFKLIDFTPKTKDEDDFGLSKLKI